MQSISNALLSRGECSIILMKFLNVKDDWVKLVDYQLERDNTAVGYLGDYYALTLCYCTAYHDNRKILMGLMGSIRFMFAHCSCYLTLNALYLSQFTTAASQCTVKQQFFVKALPQLSDEVEKEAIFSKEAWLYETLLGELQKYSQIKWSPICYYTRSDLCVLENIKLSGYSGAKTTLLSEKQLHQLLRTLAAFHAASLVYEQRKGIDIGHEFGHRLIEITVAPNIAWFTTGLAAIQAVIRTLPRYQTPEHLKFIDTKLTGIMERVYQHVSTSTKYRNVLCHRDLWAGNIFFPAKLEDGLLLIDFQTCRYTPPAIDLCFSLYLNLSTSDRQRLEKKYIDFYYDKLKMDLEYFGLQAENLISKAELLKSYEEFRLFGVVYSAIVVTIVKVPPSFVTNEYKYIDRSKIILQYMQDNAEFREAMESACVELMGIALLDS